MVLSGSRSGWLPAVLATALLGSAGCGASDDPGGASGRRAAPPSVLLIVVDTLGAKHLGHRSGDGELTPHLDRLAAEGARFDHARSTAPWTQPSVASLFTSRMPSRHGVTRLMDSLGDDAVTLAERFAEAGYATAAIVSHFLVGDEYGFDQGFDLFDASPVTDADGLTAKRVTTRAVRFLRESEGPFFLFVHYFDPHSLYNHHPEHDRTADYAGSLRPAMGVWEVRDQRDSFAPEDIEYLVGLYREEIAYTDEHIGRLLSRLEELGHAENTLVVFTADHGEEFMEHGWIGHTRTLHDELVNVPLFFRLPGTIPPRVFAEPVSTLDVAPTVLDLVLNESDPAADGRSLTSALVGDAPVVERPTFMEVSFDSDIGDPERVEQKRAFQTAIVRGTSKLVHDLRTDEWRLYDLASDPDETRGVAASDPQLFAELKVELEAWEARRTERSQALDPESLDPERLRQLEQLGYVR